MDGPPGGPFDWRLSMALVERSGAFSDYSGYERTTALVEGAGFTLRAPGAATLCFAATGDCHRYAGSLPYVCGLHAGPSWDLNLIAREGLGASMRILATGPDGLLLEASTARRYLMPLHAPVSLQADGTELRLEPGDAAVLGPRLVVRVVAGGLPHPCKIALVTVPS